MSCYAMMNALMAPDLTSNESRVWAYLLFRANGAKVCWPPVPEIAANLHMSTRRVMSATKTLQRTGRIKVTTRYKDTNNYFMLDVAGLHERPLFQNGEPLPHEPAPEIVPDDDLTKTTPVDASPDKTDILTCQKEQSDLTETSPESVQQESNKEDCSLRSQRARDLGPKSGSDDDPDFVAFWDGYPRKDDKGHARKAWIKARRTTPAATILAGLRGYPFSESPRFVPLPATWLNGERWLAAAETDMFDPVLRAVGLTPEDFAGPVAEQPWMRMLQ